MVRRTSCNYSGSFLPLCFIIFVWIWGKRCQKTKILFTDWGSYDFTVSPLALHNFEQKYGYALTAEDFVNQGKYRVTHMPPTKAKKRLDGIY